MADPSQGPSESVSDVIASEVEFYDRAKSFDDHQLAQVAGWIRRYFKTYESMLDQRFSSSDGITVLEQGAGTCTLSLLMAKKPYVRRVIACDISKEKMAALS